MKKHRLDSGLTVISDPIADSQSFTLLVMFRTGSRNETKDIWGISHFLEHMAFKGTKSYPTPEGLVKYLDSLGSMYNAFTSKEHTGYYIKCSKKVFDKSLGILAEMTIDPIVLDAEVDKERGTIIEELNMYEDDPRRKIYDYFEECIYDNEQTAQDIIGTKKSLAGIHAKQIIDYRQKYYTAGNAVISISGHIPNDLNEKVEKAFAGLSGSKLNYLEPKPSPTKRINLKYKKTQQTHLALGFPGVKVLDQDREPTSILALIFGGNMSSLMFGEVREKRGLAYYVTTYSDNMDDAGCFVTFAGVNNEKAIEAVKVIREVYDNISDNLTEAELQRAKDYMVGILTLKYESSDNRSESNATSYLYGKELTTLEEKIKIIEAVTLKEVQDVAKRILNKNKICLSLIGPFKDETIFEKILN